VQLIKYLDRHCIRQTIQLAVAAQPRMFREVDPTLLYERTRDKQNKPHKIATVQLLLTADYMS